MCNANVLKPALMESLRKGTSALKAADKKHNLKDLALAVGPVLAPVEYAGVVGPSDRHFTQSAYTYVRVLKEEATKELKMDLSHAKTQPSEAEFVKKVAEYSAFPDIKKQAFDAAFPGGITEKNRRLAAAIFEDAEPIPQTPLGELVKDHPLNEGKGKSREQARLARVSMENSPIVLTKLPADMDTKDMEGNQRDTWRYSLSNAAAVAMVREGFPLDLKGGEATTRMIEKYMARRDVQKEAYRNTYDLTNTRQARAVEKAPRLLTATLFTDTPNSPTALLATPQGGQDGPSTAADTPAPGTPEFEQEKQRRLAYWKQKAAEQLHIQAGNTSK